MIRYAFAMILPSSVALGAGSIEEATALLDRLDAARVSIEYDDEKLSAVLEDLSVRLSAPVAADWDSLDLMTVDPGDLLSLRINDTSALAALSTIALQLGDEFEHPVFEVHEGRVVLTSVQGTADMRVLDVYDVRDLLADEALVERLRVEAPPIDVPGGDEPAEETPGDADGLIDFDADEDLPPPRPMTPGEELMLLISDHVDPESWMNFGGSRALITERDGVLMVTAAPTVHRRFRDALVRLRRTSPTGVQLEAAVVEMPAVEWQRLARRYETASRAQALAALDAGGAEILWRASTTVVIGAEYAASSTGESVEIGVAVTPRFDTERGVLSLEVEIVTESDGDRRKVSTVAPIPARNGAAIIEIPPAKPADRVRLLVVVPGR